MKEKEYVAIKKLPHITESNEEDNWSEVYFLSQAKHPNVVSFKKAFLVVSKKHDPEMWIVMEFLQVI
jgi:hypothetical protein